MYGYGTSLGPGASSPGEQKPGTQGSGDRCDPMTTGECTPEKLQSRFGDGATRMSRIAHHESNCTALESGIDTMWDDPQNRAFSAGVLQVNLAKHQITCGGERLDCPSAFNPPANPNFTKTVIIDGKSVTLSAGSGYGYTVRPDREDLYNKCIAAAMDVSCNLDKAKELYDARRARGQTGFEDWKISDKACNLP